MAIKLEDFSLSSDVMLKGSLHKVGVVGCGIMGQQIALQTSQYGIDVVFVDLTEELVEKVKSAMSETLDGIINKWGMTAGEKKLILSRIYGTTDFSALAECDVIIETINSSKPGTSLPLRQNVFRKIEENVRPDAVIASNTATLMISDLSSVLKNPERAIGLHFIAPVRDVKIVELVRSLRTSQTAYEMAAKYVKMIGKKGIDVNESPGNISTRMIIPFVNEACEILMEGVASVSDIDETMCEASGHQMGPFEIADRVGLDKLLRWMENLYCEFGQVKYKPSPLIKRLVRAGMNGQISGEGFYKWSNGRKVGKKGPISNLGRE
ncbi:MAG: 3-hydroxyacyl-CoA dehydrogenase family protein [Bacteroidales bacterium]|nr:3-hydroxyacyl-CoA dehydrogenase family protein [Bacteroidales bacterium]